MKIDWLFVKFIFVGVLNTAFGYLAYALLLFLGLHYTLAVVLSTIAGVLFNFKTTGTIVFKNNNNKLIFKFVAVYAITTTLGIIILRMAELAGIYGMKPSGHSLSRVSRINHVENQPHHSIIMLVILTV